MSSVPALISKNVGNALTNYVNWGGIMLNAKLYGAKGDGVTDDTAAIQTALYYVSTFKKTVYLPDGDYVINPVTKLRFISNTALEFSMGARLICNTPTATTYSMLDIVSVQNIEIINPTIVGSRTTTQPTVEGAGYGISCRDVTNLKITGARISNCYTDGIYINDVTNGLIEFTNSDNNRRQGMSVICCDNLHVRDSSFGNSNGTAPQSGIDTEPNSANEQIKGLVYENVKTYSNTGSGFAVNYNALDNAATVVDITYINCKDEGSLNAITVTKFLGSISEASTIKFIDCRSTNALEAGMKVLGHKAAGTAKISFIRPVIHNPNVNGGTNQRQQDVAFSINSEITGYPAGVEQGNVYIQNPTITIASGRSILRGFFIGYNQPYKNIIIEDPIKIDIGTTSLLSNNSNFNLIAFYDIPVSGVKVTDAFNVLSVETATSLIRNFDSSIYSEYISTITANGALTNFAQWNVLEYVRVIKKGVGGTLTVNLLSSITFIESGAVITGSLASSTTGAVLSFKKLKDNFYKVIKEYGTWA